MFIEIACLIAFAAFMLSAVVYICGRPVRPNGRRNRRLRRRRRRVPRDIP